MVSLLGPACYEGNYIMVSRIYEGEIRRWWDNHLDQFVAQQAELTNQKESVLKDLVLFSESASDTYEIL